jgi:hypothetical protein
LKPSRVRDVFSLETGTLLITPILPRRILTELFPLKGSCCLPFVLTKLAMIVPYALPRFPLLNWRRPRRREVNQVSRLILTKGEFTEVVEHSYGEAMGSKCMITEEVWPKLILIVAPYP